MKVPFDLEAMLKPISDESPCGEPLAYQGVYDRVREERRQDDELERGIWQAQLKKADWAAVERICRENLESRSKDLYLAAWLFEAWIHRYGFAGARAGFQILTGLCRQFGFDLYPRALEASESDLETVLAPVEWLNAKMPAQLKLIPLTRPDSGDAPRYSWADYEAAARTGGADFQLSVTRTSDRLLHELQDDAQGALDECAGFAAAMAEVYGPGAPALGQITAVLQPIVAYLGNALNARGGVGKMQVESTESPAELKIGLNTGLETGTIRTRAEAYRRLAEASDFLASTEPHSPVPYLVRRAIYWGGMRLDELLPELVQNQTDLGDIHRLLQMGAAKRTS